MPSNQEEHPHKSHTKIVIGLLFLYRIIMALKYSDAYAAAATLMTGSAR